jgi:dihydrofolate reductase
MTQVVYYVAASQDGYIAGPNGELDWLPQAHSDSGAEQDYGYAEFFAGIDGLVMGRTTYQVSLSFGQGLQDWPYGDKPAWVFSRQGAAALQPVPAQVRITQDTPVSLLAHWQRLGLSKVWLVGGGQLAAQFFQAGCLHEIVLATIPRRLGAGIPLMGPLGTHVPMLYGTQKPARFAEGVSSQRYYFRS